MGERGRKQERRVEGEESEGAGVVGKGSSNTATSPKAGARNQSLKTQISPCCFLRDMQKCVKGQE